ncbi:MAG: hypothetical protein D6741_00340 [Planctomycetota bacterium]|nr:MAG: hypothetical protein D6741_00340 [Planctomycetota bacterium]
MSQTKTGWNPLGPIVLSMMLGASWFAMGTALGRDVPLSRKPVQAVSPDPTAETFPGAVPEDAPRVIRTIVLDPRISRWHSTGLYAAPGEAVQVQVPVPWLTAKLRLRIGCHKDRLREPKKRPSEITLSVPIDRHVVGAANPFGGPIYIEVPNEVPAPLARVPLRVQIAGAVPAPYFVLGKTTNKEWQDELRSLPAPWAELAGRKIILSVPSSVVRDLDAPEALMEFWDRVIECQDELAGTTGERRYPERMVPDVQISAGYMHSGYPIMVQYHSAKVMVDLEKLRTNGHGDVWGFFHELGHNHQSSWWVFGGSVEVSCNFFTLYCIEKLCGNQNLRREATWEYCERRLKEHVANGAPFDEWRRDPFLGLQTFRLLQREFGWDLYRKTFRAYRQLPPSMRPKNDDEKRDLFIVMLSRSAGRDLTTYFEKWGFPVSEAAKAQTAALPVWLPEIMQP